MSDVTKQIGHDLDHRELRRIKQSRSYGSQYDLLERGCQCMK